jgi:hypothetical protein
MRSCSIKKNMSYLLAALVFVFMGCNKKAPSATDDSTPAANSSAPDANASNQAAANQQPAANEGAVPNQPQGSNAAPTAAPEPAPIIVRAGRDLAVTLGQSVSSKDANPGDPFDASLAEPVTDNGEVVIPAGARAKGTIVDAKSAGRFRGGASLSITLDAITVRGKTYRVQTASIVETSKGRGKRTGIGAGGGAAFGALIGAIAGGGKGAAIGAAAGAGAGTAGAGFTGNRDITIPAETRLTFKLREPLRLDAK